MRGVDPLLLKGFLIGFEGELGCIAFFADMGQENLLGLGIDEFAHISRGVDIGEVTDIAMDPFLQNRGPIAMEQHLVIVIRFKDVIVAILKKRNVVIGEIARIGDVTEFAGGVFNNETDRIRGIMRDRERLDFEIPKFT